MTSVDDVKTYHILRIMTVVVLIIFCIVSLTTTYSITKKYIASPKGVSINCPYYQMQHMNTTECHASIQYKDTIIYVNGTYDINIYS